MEQRRIQRKTIPCPMLPVSSIQQPNEEEKTVEELKQEWTALNEEYDKLEVRKKKIEDYVEQRLNYVLEKVENSFKRLTMEEIARCKEEFEQTQELIKEDIRTKTEMLKETIAFAADEEVETFKKDLENKIGEGLDYSDKLELINKEKFVEIGILEQKIREKQTILISEEKMITEMQNMISSLRDEFDAAINEWNTRSDIMENVLRSLCKDIDIMQRKYRFIVRYARKMKEEYENLPVDDIDLLNRTC